MSRDNTTLEGHSGLESSNVPLYNRSHIRGPHRCARSQIGVMYGNPEVTSGGNALKFYASVRLEVRRKQTIEGAKGENIGIRVKAKARIPYERFHQTVLTAVCSMLCILHGTDFKSSPNFQ